MSGDPFQVYRNGRDRQKENLRVMWAELAAALEPDKQVVRPAPCAAAFDCPRPGVGRLRRNGTPACEEHIKLSSRRGGWPLKLLPPEVGR